MNSKSMLTIGREMRRKKYFECGVWFQISPTPSSREYSVTAHDSQSKDVICANFITNQHLLVQFSRIPEKDEKGMIY